MFAFCGGFLLQVYFLVLMVSFFLLQEVAPHPALPPRSAPAPRPDIPLRPAPMDVARPHVEAPVDEVPLDEAPVDDDAYSLEPVPVSARKKKVVADLHTQLAGHLPELFHHVEEVVPYYETRGDPVSPLLILDPDLSRSWLRPPVSLPGDTVGYWPVKDCKLPPTRRTLFPPTTKSKPLGRTPYYHVADEKMKKALEATTQLDKVPLDLKAFDVADVSVRSVPQAPLDVLLRKALLESFTTDAYLKIVLHLSECISGASQSISQLEAIELLPGVVRQAAMSNARSGQSLSAGFVGNIVALRDVVLGRFSPRAHQGSTQGWRFYW